MGGGRCKPDKANKTLHNAIAAQRLGCWICETTPNTKMFTVYNTSNGALQSCT
jgi:hypothetical protein